MLFPSVTEVLKPYCDFSSVPAAELDEAAARGTTVHDACASIAQGLPLFYIPKKIEGYLQSYIRWFDSIVDEVLLVEERLTDNEFGYHGAPDSIFKTKQGDVILVDNKTPTGLVRAWQLQCAGYYNLAVKSGIRPDKTGSLMLNPEGKAAKVEYYENSRTDFPMFLQALNLFRFFNTK